MHEGTALGFDSQILTPRHVLDMLTKGDSFFWHFALEERHRQLAHWRVRISRTGSQLEGDALALEWFLAELPFQRNGGHVFNGVSVKLECREKLHR